MFIVKDIKISCQVELILTDIDGNSTVFLKLFKHLYTDELKLCIVMCFLTFKTWETGHCSLFYLPWGILFCTFKHLCSDQSAHFLPRSSTIPGLLAFPDYTCSYYLWRETFINTPKESKFELRATFDYGF